MGGVYIARFMALLQLFLVGVFPATVLSVAAEHPELLHDPLYGNALGSGPSSFKYRYYSSIYSYVEEKDLFPRSVSQPELISTPKGPVPKVLVVPPPSELATWPVECFSLQRRLYAHTVEQCFDKLCATLRLSGDSHVARLESLAKQHYPATSKGCPFMPKTVSSDKEATLFHAPMSLMSLRANQDFYELQNMTFCIVTSLQCGVPLPAHVLRAAAT